MKIRRGELQLFGLENYEKIIDSLIETLMLQEKHFDLKVILTEGLTNAHRHGNMMDSTKPIFLSYSCDENMLNIRIRDCGSNTRRIEIPQEICRERLLDECGRGLFMIRCFADKVELNGNTLIVDKLLKADLEVAH